MTMLSYSNNKGFINSDENTSKSFTVMERAGIDFRSNVADFGLNGNIRYNNVTNSFQAQNNRRTYNYGAGATTTLYLPLNFKVESDINFSTNSGYSAGYEQEEWLWNASASKTFLKNNQGTIRFKVYDILQQRSNISRNVTASSITDSQYNTLNSYFMVHFIYRSVYLKVEPPVGCSNGTRQRRTYGTSSGTLLKKEIHSGKGFTCCR
jgi:hypothetical protein